MIDTTKNTRESVGRTLLNLAACVTNGTQPSALMLSDIRHFAWLANHQGIQIPSALIPILRG